MSQQENIKRKCDYIHICFLLAICIITPCTINAQEERDLLTDYYTPKFVRESIPNDYKWIPYPDYKDRLCWEKISDVTRQSIITEGEKYLGFEWPLVSATSYLDYAITGKRDGAQRIIQLRIKVLRALVFAELIEGHGRFLNDIINGVFSFCEQTTWEVPSRFYLYGFEGSVSNPTTILPDITNPIIGLTSSDIAADLAWVLYFFREEFNNVSPIISQRLKQEIETKILIPYYKRNDYWWITGWGEGRVNNWTPWCNLNILTCILLVEKDPVKRLDGIYKTMGSVDIFINSYPEDGGCSEGPSYWAHAAGKMYQYLNLLKNSSQGRLDLFNNELIKNMGRYIYRVYIGNENNYINFADAPLHIQHDPRLIYRYGRSIQDSTMVKFAAHILRNSKNRIVVAKSSIGEVLENIFNLDEWQQVEPEEPLISDLYLPGIDLAMARSQQGSNNGFFFSAKGGSNDENHNHNDVGSFMLYYNGEPILIDVGVGTYTKETFGKGRYNIWTMQSSFHNIPLINNTPQRNGSEFRAKNSIFKRTVEKVTFSTDISNAYPIEAKASKWIRTYELVRGGLFSIVDDYQLLENNGNTRIYFMSSVPCKILKNGVIEFNSKRFKLHMEYDDSQLEATIEPIKINDKRLQRSLGKEIYRIGFNLQNTSRIGKIIFSIKEK